MRHCASGTVDWLKAAFAAGGCTRISLARELCEREDWRNAKGKLCLASARSVLPKLSSALGLPLPAALPMGGVTTGSLAPSPYYPDRRLRPELLERPKRQVQARRLRREWDEAVPFIEGAGAVMQRIDHEGIDAERVAGA